MPGAAVPPSTPPPAAAAPTNDPPHRRLFALIPWVVAFIALVAPQVSPAPLPSSPLRTQSHAWPAAPIGMRVEPALRAVLAHEADQILSGVLPRVKTESCRKTVLDVAEHTRSRFTRAFVRHPHAEEWCPISNNVDGHEHQSAKLWEQPVPPVGCDAKLAFLIELVPKVDRFLLDRLLKKVMRRQHVYQFHIDFAPDPPSTRSVARKSAASVEMCRCSFSPCHGGSPWCVGRSSSR